MPEQENEVTIGKDPTKSVLSKSGLNSKHLCDYVINVATGCSHGCKFCYVPSTPVVRTRPDMLEEHAGVEDPQREWGGYVLYRDDLAERLDECLERKRKWKSTEKGCGIVGISFATDCYMDGRAGGITRDVIKVLSDHEKFARVLTRNPILALQDLDVFKNAGEYVTIGSSIPSLNSEFVQSLEPRAPLPEHRLRGLAEFNKNDVQTYVSMSPTYPTQTKADLRKLLREISMFNPGVIFHEPINPRGANFDMTVEAAKEDGHYQLAEELERLKNREIWADYAVTHLRWVQTLGEELNLPIHLWPDKQLLKYVDDEECEWLKGWRNRQSPESFSGRITPQNSAPSAPRTSTTAD